MSRRRVWTAAAVASLGVVMLAVVLALRFGRDPRIVQSPLVGHPVPARTLPSLHGEHRIALRARSGALTLVNFWAPWCTACRAEHAALQAAARQFGPARVRVVGVLYQDSSSSARNFLDTFGQGFPVVTDPGGRAAIDFGIFGIPETFFVDSGGRVVAKVSGPLNTRVINDLVTSIERGELPASVPDGTIQSKPGR
jgi:cytochrome c biogenesis protein CcmG/thiol:disulfide interchange protein DsbE